ASPKIDPEPLPDVVTRATAAMRRLADRDGAERRVTERLRDWERGRARLWDSDRRRANPPALFAPLLSPPGDPAGPIAPGTLPMLPRTDTRPGMLDGPASPNAEPARAPTPRPSILGRLRIGDRGSRS